MKIYLIRHGLTESNKQKLYTGWTDVDLAPEGVAQVEALASGFSGEEITGLFSSDLRRAVKTAEIIGAGHGLKPEPSPLLREINFGAWEGLRYEEILASYEDELHRWYNDPFMCAPPGGESLRQVFTRVNSFLDDLWEQENKGTFVIVSHGGAIRSVLHHYLGLEKDRFFELAVDNAAVSLLEKDAQGIRVSYMNKRL
ncbi:MAG TPA: alpha-ribazole phosphatase [Firmicutes bacterium]|jgi:alpha-ribazole phosphatase|nr:alpha-ribazole phosphatase [Bacillota bacterium]